MATRPKTAVDKYFARRMKDPRFAAAYRAARAEIDATDQLIRALDAARVVGGFTKAELAKRLEVRPEMIRRLFTAPGRNPTMATVLKVATVLGYHLELVPDFARARGGGPPRSVTWHGMRGSEPSERRCAGRGAGTPLRVAARAGSPAS